MTLEELLLCKNSTTKSRGSIMGSVIHYQYIKYKYVKKASCHMKLVQVAWLQGITVVT